MGHKLGEPQPANHVAAILIGAPALDAQAGRAQPLLRRQRSAARTGLALGY